MWEGVVEADIVPIDEAHLGVTKTLDTDGWRAFRTNGAKGAVTRFVIDAARWKPRCERVPCEFSDLIVVGLRSQI